MSSVALLDESAVDDERVYGMRALPPVLALADLYADPKAWHPDPDDLDIHAEQSDAVRSAGDLLTASYGLMTSDQ